MIASHVAPSHRPVAHVVIMTCEVVKRRVQQTSASYGRRPLLGSSSRQRHLCAKIGRVLAKEDPATQWEHMRRGATVPYLMQFPPTNTIIPRNRQAYAMATCCKRQDSEPKSTCCSSERGMMDGVENDVKNAPVEATTDVRCSGEICSGMACPRALSVVRADNH